MPILAKEQAALHTLHCVSRILGVSMSPLLNLFPNQMSDRLWMKRHILEHPPILLLPSSPHGVDECATCLSSFLFDNTRKSTVSPRINDPSQGRWGCTNGSIPSKNPLSHRCREATIKQEVLHSF
jgi:hypothetical protein